MGVGHPTAPPSHSSEISITLETVNIEIYIYTLQHHDEQPHQGLSRPRICGGRQHVTYDMRTGQGPVEL